MTRRPLTSLLWTGFLAILLCWLLCGCGRKVVTLTQYKSDSVAHYQADTAAHHAFDKVVREWHDTIIQRDSVYVLVKGDTVYRDRYQWRDRVINHIDTVVRERVDTVIRTSRDTVSVIQKIPYEVTREVVKEVNKLHWWQTALMWIGGVALLSLLAFVIVKFKIKK